MSSSEREKEWRASRRRADEGIADLDEAISSSTNPRRTSSVRSSYLDSRAGRSSTTAEKPSSRASLSSLTHEDEIERIREMRARRLRQEQEAAAAAAGETKDDDAVARKERIRQRRSEAVSNPSRTRSTPTMSRRELEDAGLVRRDRRTSSRFSSLERDGSEADEVSSSHVTARRERRSQTENEGSGSGGLLAATTRLDIEARMAARRSSRLLAESADQMGNTKQMTLEELRTRREETRNFLSSSMRRRGSSVEARAVSDGEGDDDNEESDKTPTKERIRQRAERRGVPRRTKSADDDLMAMRASSRKFQSEEGDLDESEERRLEQEQHHRSSLASSLDLSARLKERREARAAEREAREREKKASSDIGLIRRHSRRTTTEMRTVAGESFLPDLELSGGEESEDDGAPGWSVRLCLVSAMDLPLVVVPNTPLCPVVKFGLVRLPSSSTNDTEQAVTEAVMTKLGKRGIESIKSAKVCTTTQKLLSKRDNGSIDFHQEYRWDQIRQPANVGLYVELCARAVHPPANLAESPSAISQRNAYTIHDLSVSSDGAQSRESLRGVNRTLSGSDDNSGFRSFWKNNPKKQAELEAAEAAAAVARMLVEDGGDQTQEGNGSSTNGTIRISTTPQSDYEVTLRPGTKNQTSFQMTKDEMLGSLVIPLSKLPLKKAVEGNQTVRLEQWYQLECEEETAGSSPRRKKPSVLLEISFSAPEILDDSEDEFEDDLDLESGGDQSDISKSAILNASFSRRSRMEARGQNKNEPEKPKEESKLEDPVLEPGIVDFVAVVGCKDIGKQKNDDGSKGWVKSTPDSVILEQFPPKSDYHVKNGRNTLLPEMVQWFCFPEGVRLWRGTAPPSHSDLNLKRFSAASPPNIASSIAAFDACLNCTTSFSWFVIASNSDEYGSSLVKTYGAVIRFYAPAPIGIDPTQDDFAQTVLGNVTNSSATGPAKRLWVPVGICLTSNMPIIGILEALLLRLCEELSTVSSGHEPAKLQEIHVAVANMILNFQKPLAGAVNCSVPFLDGDRFLFSLPPPTGLPAIPHGRAIVSVCRLLGAEGLNYLISAVLTECKILFHSQEIADIAMVAETVTALTYPFVWSLPYVPILPLGMLEFVEAPLSYILGIPTCNLKLIDPRALDDVVVIDLDNGFSPIDHNQKRRQSRGGNKHPTPLPASVATNISKAVYKLLRLEEEMEEEFGSIDFEEQTLPRLESESLPEREFRVEVAIEICGMLRGYQDCIGTVFNRDKFLKIAPVLYEERRDNRGVGGGLSARGGSSSQNKVLSARSKRFLSLLVNGQNFQQLVESLESTELSFFHEIMELIDDSSSEGTQHIVMRSSSGDTGSSNKVERYVQHLVKSLQKVEDKIPTYRVEKGGRMNAEADEDADYYLEEDFDDFDAASDSMEREEREVLSFTTNLLLPIESESATVESSEPGRQSLSMEYLAKLEETPWEYNSLFNIPLAGDASEEGIIDIYPKVKLRDAIGERRFRAWKSSHLKRSSDADLAFLPESARAAAKHGAALNLNSLVTSAKSDMTDMSSISSGGSSLRTSTLSPEQQRVADAKSRDAIRRCLDKAQGTENTIDDPSKIFVENGRDLIAEAENALRNHSAQLFLLKILAQRSRLESQRVRSIRRQTVVSNSASRLDFVAFTCLVRLSCAMLDSCMEFKEYEPAYRLLTYTAGFIMVLGGEEDETEHAEGHHRTVITMTSRVGLHPIFADIAVWETVMQLHLRDRISARKTEGNRLGQDEESVDDEEDEIEYEAAVATLYEMVGYGIPGEELSRFAMRASEGNGWFCDDRGRQLLMLARRISIRRDQVDFGGAGDAGDIEMYWKGPETTDSTLVPTEYHANPPDIDDYVWKETGWCHPAAPSSRVFTSSSVHSDASMSYRSDELMKRSAVTALASFGTSLVVSGGLDGGVFLAHSISDNTISSDGQHKACEVRGIHLDWGSASRAGTGASSDGEYGVGAVSCLEATLGGGFHHNPNMTQTKDAAEGVHEGDFVESMEGCRIVAGTTAGDLRVWSVKDIYAALLMIKHEEAKASSRLKFSLRGRALSGHRGGVTCIDAPSEVYRPDSLVTGGADGLIKLWSLRAPTASRRTSSDSDPSTGGAGPQRGRGGDAVNTLSGHVGRILCIQTAWHGDHLLSGGADRTIRVWDLASGGGKSLHTLCGHLGWVTNVQYWGPNTIVSASTDRSIALWDARVRNSPLFMLRHHHSPISDLLVGSRTDPHMVSAGTDGSIAAWDFRLLSVESSSYSHTKRKDAAKTCTIVREPSVSIRHSSLGAGPTLLTRGVKDPINAFLSVGSDCIIREWNVSSGEMLEETPTGHCDAITIFDSFTKSNDIGSPQEKGESNTGHSLHKGTLTSSLDGTIRLRKLVRKIQD
ncbi:WD40 repeat-containing protein [Nitzschia inconspicua]|uniref:WD40 repeat-containing protein n=1 Tax=Nitzschia inconspicua TaxID=303405 RepID=A0A9K3KG88_9STRA|nr:WD40 repeat-containing protein [Nitzschia inconspicua]